MLTGLCNRDTVFGKKIYRYYYVKYINHRKYEMQYVYICNKSELMKKTIKKYIFK